MPPAADNPASGPANGFIENVSDGLVNDKRTHYLPWKEPVVTDCATVNGADIINEDGQCLFGKYSIALAPVLGFGDEDAVLAFVDITTVQMAEFADTDAGRIKESYLGLMLDVRDGIDNGVHFFPCGDTREGCVIPEERHFVFVPVAFQDIMPEMMELGDMDIDGAVADPTHAAQIIDIRADFRPGDLLDGLAGKLGFDPFNEFDKVGDIS